MLRFRRETCTGSLIKNMLRFVCPTSELKGYSDKAVKQKSIQRL